MRALDYFLLSLVVLAVLVVFIYFEKDWLYSLQLGKPQAAFWDVAFKGIAGFGAIFGAWVALSKYFDESSKANQAALIEAQKPFYTKRQEVYYQLVSHTATIGTRDGDIRDHLREEAEEQFWLLYWGVVPMVADEQVGKAVDAFSDALQEFYDFRKVYEAINNQDPDKKKEKEKKFVNLRNKSMDLARACRKSLGFIEPTSGSHPDAQMTIAGRMGLL